VNPDLPPPLATLIEQLLAKNPEHRPQSARAVVEAIEAIERRRSAVRRFETSRRGLLIAANVGLVVCLGLGAWLAASWWWPTAPPPPEQPGRVTFEFDEPELQLAVRRDQEKEVVIDPKADPVQTLLPGTYRMRTTINKEGRRLVPDEFVVKAGEPLTVAPRLVGEIARVKGFSRSVTGVAAPPRPGESIFVASSLDANAVLGVWDGKSDSFKSPADSMTPMTCVAFAPDGIHAATAGGKEKPGRDTSIHLWDVQGPAPRLLGRLAGHEEFVTALAYSPKGGRLISADNGGAVHVWDLEKQIRLFSLTSRELRGPVHAVAFSADEKQALTGDDTRAILWDVDGKEVKQMWSNDARILSLAFGPGPDEVTVGCNNGSITLWSVEDKPRRDLQGHKGAVNTVGVSPDGKRLLSGGADGTIRFWDAATGRELYVFTPGEEPVNGVAFTADGRRAVSGGADRALRLWELPR
jgi:hypothetical protein